ncbi:MAG: hypothetical protein A3J46_03100 [Candidatus Yanofskybacteria bacterium RIFCSPHIGHO2_02_FULL_41_11]|uniref:Uncharacterized protein n=1 Tax=Candidatus Yanofskybacteria bacterium RIFCSPHIGHO2_02_FULL_41_11 TaxID=1802675 RepID=A0A1F8F6S4_9BACT|nr:MAG: hypothetical protein A3J46_03100 [Candidatus Yanofskybacteria bacterium RIFCSPHIGHO2_02_FULL_41_11]
MANQELQNYIQQARAQGQTDAQIQQALLQQGWNINDINQALNPAGPYHGAGQAKKSKLPTIILAVVFIVLLLVFLGGLKNNNKDSTQNNVPSSNDLTTEENQGNFENNQDGSTNNGLNLSATGCVVRFAIYYKFIDPQRNLLSSLPSSFSDIPRYPGSEFAGTVQLDQQYFDPTNPKPYKNLVNFCTSASLAEVENYFKNSSSAWVIKASDKPIDSADPYSGQSVSGTWLVGYKNSSLVGILLVHPQNYTYITYWIQ